jgi:hypothetical protein
MAEHQWSPPEHQDVTLHQPIGFNPELAGTLTPIDPPQPVWADIRFSSIPDVLHLKCFAIASSDVAVLVQTSWQGRLQEVLVDRGLVMLHGSSESLKSPARRVDGEGGQRGQ